MDRTSYSHAKMRNPTSGRWVLKNGKIGEALIRHPTKVRPVMDAVSLRIQSSGLTKILSDGEQGEVGVQIALLLMGIRPAWKADCLANDHARAVFMNTISVSFPELGCFCHTTPVAFYEPVVYSRATVAASRELSGALLIVRDAMERGLGDGTSTVFGAYGLILGYVSKKKGAASLGRCRLFVNFATSREELFSYAYEVGNAAEAARLIHEYARRANELIPPGSQIGKRKIKSFTAVVTPDKKKV